MPIYSVLWKDNDSTGIGKFEFDSREQLNEHIERICSKPLLLIRGTKAVSIVEVPGDKASLAYDLTIHPKSGL
ncbi:MULTISPECIES: hypothetical protein [Pseudobacillus]|uniref:hypothetical protein n=1 Tax=Pseudobacillus TaxID=108525 RepID=UPI00387A77E2